MPPSSKRRKTESTVIEEITFDPEARLDYLTGFHKRKLQRAKHAKEIAEKKARAERIEHRRKLREERKRDLERHIAEISTITALAGQDLEATASASDDKVEGEKEDDRLTAPPEVDHEAEYVDEDRYTTVTVEAMDLSRDGFHEAEKKVSGDSLYSASEEVKDGKQAGDETHEGQKQVKPTWTKQKPQEPVTPRRKRKKFRYENKVERKLARIKEGSKNRKQAKARRAL